MKQNSYQKIFHPYIPATVNDLESWLEKRSRLGWRLVKIRCWVFTFQKCAPYNGKYFIYRGFDASRGLSFDFYIAKKKYAVGKSNINKEHTYIFEVDISKVDDLYDEYVRIRNSFYKNHYLKLAIVSLTCLVLSIILFFCSGGYIALTIFWLILFMYGCFSFRILKKEINSSNIKKEPLS